MNSQKKVSFPDELLVNSRVETSIFDALNEQNGVAALSEEIDMAHILRLYQLVPSGIDNAYHPVQELAAFRFEQRHELLHFLDRLPNMSGLEMLLMLNPLLFEKIEIN